MVSNSYVVVVQSVSYILLLATPWTVAHQASLSFTISQSLLKFMSIESVMLSDHLIHVHYNVGKGMKCILQHFPSNFIAEKKST